MMQAQKTMDIRKLSSQFYEAIGHFCQHRVVSRFAHEPNGAVIVHLKDGTAKRFSIHKTDTGIPAVRMEDYPHE